SPADGNGAETAHTTASRCGHHPNPHPPEYRHGRNADWKDHRNPAPGQSPRKCHALPATPESRWNPLPRYSEFYRAVASPPDIRDRGPAWRNHLPNPLPPETV